MLTKEQYDSFWENGYVIIPNLFDTEEVSLISDYCRAVVGREKVGVHAMPDGKGMESKIHITSTVEEDLMSAMSRLERIVGAGGNLMSDTLVHFHHKLMIKEPHVGGAWEWHQDYGYWYNDSFLFPNLISCMVAVDRASKENGCLQVIRGSHKAGRFTHGQIGSQVGADQSRVEDLLKRLDLVYCEMEAGSGLFFHCNLLHRSDANLSPYPRWAYISCYTTKSNMPYRESNFAQMTPITVLPDDQFRQLASDQLAQVSLVSK